MGNNQSNQDQDAKLAEYVRNQQQNVNQYYNNYGQILQTENAINAPKVEVEKTMAIKNDFFITKTSFKLVESQQPGFCAFTFKYTAIFPIVFKFYLFANESINKETNASIDIQSQSQHSVIVQPGKDVSFQEGLFCIPIHQDLKKYNFQENSFPLLIYVQPEYQTSDLRRQFYYIVFKFQQNHLPTPECVRFKLEANGQTFITSDVFGLATDKECSVCLTEPINTIIRPCRHMCLCKDCCEGMRVRAQNCPICRGKIESFTIMEKLDQ